MYAVKGKTWWAGIGTLTHSNCHSQGYDAGTGAVAGKVNGLAALFLKENPKALYTHTVLATDWILPFVHLVTL